MSGEGGAVMSTGRVCVVGSINMDLVTRTPRLPAPGETILGGPFATFPGGKGANQAVAAARAGASVAMIGAVAGDAFGAAMLEVLVATGIETAGVARRGEGSTGVAVITVESLHGENTIVVAPGANASVDGALVSSAGAAVAGAAVTLAQLEVPAAAIAKAFGIARRSGAVTVLNAAPAPADRAVWTGLLWPCTDILIVNMGEAAAVAGRGGDTDPLAAARELLGTAGRAGPRLVVVTLGPRGAVLVDASGVEHVSSPRVCAVDTVGAGDTFCGYFSAGIAAGRTAASSAERACRAAAISVMREGAIPSIPMAAEVDPAVG